MTLRSPICDSLKIDVPIVLAGMGGASTPALAAAVSNAGGLGVLGAAAAGPKALREMIEETRSLTDRPFGVDTLLPASVRRKDVMKAPGAVPDLAPYQEFTAEFIAREGLPPVSGGELASLAPGEDGPMIFTKQFFEAQMEVIIEERVPVYAAGLGDPGPWMDRLHANGTFVIAVVGKVLHAQRVAGSGVDMIVAQGHDAGGHNSPVGTMALIPQVVDAVDVPVLGAGGIIDGRGVAAAMMLGAAGAWVGTAFLATEEAGIHDFQKQALVDSGESDTTVSRVLTGKPARMIKSLWSQAWEEAEIEPLPMPFQSIVSAPAMAAGIRARRADILPGFAGQGVGGIRSVRPAAEVLESMAREAEQVLKGASDFL
ncbi:MAG TPA: nitronate monooxygenase [Myxococcales bacterium]|nr:nitronate monooxygenase [Myxococcales bacterium]HIL01566.1 nitronate monooxygenase [Myxococcales bacterium]